jgi:uncharacterized protein (DUF1015 family)
MTTIEPLRALHYDLQRTGGLDEVVSPPYDVIDGQQRARLAARSPYNVVAIDLPEGGEDRYDNAARILGDWRLQGIVVRDEQPALWTLSQDYIGPDGVLRTRQGFFARVRVQEYGPGRIRPHERTHPGPKEDRLRLTRATKANLSPIFSLYSDPDRAAWAALSSAGDLTGEAEATDEDGTVSRLARVIDPAAIDAARTALQDTELLIADGHHRYETARVYAEEIGGEGEHRYVLMCLVALQDPGLTVFPTHRLVGGLDAARREALATVIRSNFETVALDETAQLAPASSEEVRIGYIDSQVKQPFMLTLRDPRIADEALPDRSPAYRRLDTAVLEALILKGALGMTDHDIDELDGLGYARDFAQALALIEDGSSYDAAFFMAPTPVQRIQEVAAAGESMPPKSTYFFPKVPTGLLFNPLG